ncbi:hypothetical protein TREES_T100017679 [Tupaia chinensis]|uniref:Uncharacterized protein n=1 Tax=Tupaia chinensis TaxID=246437 RepID=L9KYE1_TUPCH|nr:hypothetical protein TREES_T100017679 [Tupaia chinensis]
MTHPRALAPQFPRGCGGTKDRSLFPGNEIGVFESQEEEAKPLLGRGSSRALGPVCNCFSRPPRWLRWILELVTGVKLVRYRALYRTGFVKAEITTYDY